MTSDGSYELVQLRNGAHSVRSRAHGETMHPGLGPAAEAEALYVTQLRLGDRMKAHSGEFVVWDVGIGAAANALTVLRATCDIDVALRLVSFDHTVEPLQFALSKHAALGYFAGYEAAVETLLTRRTVSLENHRQRVHWTLHQTDFPSWLSSDEARKTPTPHAVLFDPWSPAKNPAMWTAPLFANLFALLDPEQPCALPTYSRSTMFRAGLLLAGFYVGAGRAAGSKEETTIAANQRGLIEELLDRRWLERARRSPSAEPLWEPIYRQAPLSPGTLERLQRHPQFQ